MSVRSIALIVCSLLLGTLPALGNEIGFVETFSLAPDRAKVLEQLTPGTDDYYFYHCLHHQNSGERDLFKKIMELWTQRQGTTPRATMLSLRQDLLDYSADPSATLVSLISRLGLSFHHRREDARAADHIPSELRPGALDPVGRLRAILQESWGFDELTEYGLRSLEGQSLSENLLRQLIGKLDRPDYPSLVGRLAEEMTTVGGQGFGRWPIHQRLTLDQLQELSRRHPQLLREDAFVRAWVSRLRPPEHVDLGSDREERTRHLQRLLEFARTLEPVHDGLKALVLHQILKEERDRGVYPRDLLLEYLALPRTVSYLSRAMRDNGRRQMISMGISYEAETGLPALNDDEALVREHIAYHLLDASGLAGFDSFVDDTWLRKLQAETRVLAGDPETERYASVLSPSEYQVLRDRTDLEIAPTNPSWLAPADPVKLEVHVKNVKNLIVKAFQIDPFNLYRESGQEIDQAIDLDGLIAAEERTFEYAQSPLVRHLETFEFPSMVGRGLWVVELIGNGKSSRAVIRKGRFELLQEPSTAGVAYRVIDEAGVPVPGATIWMGGREYTPDADGRVVMPFTDADGNADAIVRHEGFASLTSLQNRGESYQLQAGFHVERDALIEGNRARLLVRPRLLLASRPVSLALLKQVRLVVEAVDMDGISTREEVADFVLKDDGDSFHELLVPPRLSRLRFVLSAQVESLRQGRMLDVVARDELGINERTRSETVRDWFLRRQKDRWTIHCLGRNGEPVPGRVVQVMLHHRDFRTEFSDVLRTDAEGRVGLGPLEGVTDVRIAPEGDEGHAWSIAPPAPRYPARIVAAPDEPVRLPRPLRPAASASLLARVGDTYVADVSAKLIESPGRLDVAGLPPGTYDLHLGPGGQPLVLEVLPGARVAGYALSPRESVETTPTTWPTLSSIAIQGEEMVITLEGVTESTRVLVAGGWTQPPWSMLPVLGWQPTAQPLRIPRQRPESMYTSGRAIGDELRYVLERRYAAKHPGVMLERPALVLNPWSRREAASAVQEAQAGEEYSSRSQERFTMASAGPPAPPPASGHQDPSCVDFLGFPAVLESGLVPEGGLIRVPLSHLPPHVRVLIVDGDMAVEESIALADLEIPVRDRKLAASLDTARTYATTKLTTAMDKDISLRIEDRLSCRLRAFTTLREVYELLMTLCPDDRLAGFAPVLDWPSLSPEDKQKRYSELASHELHFFLSRKDPAFFEEVVKPYIANKLEKTFLDHYLLGDDLTGYHEPWEFGRLNVVERILLAQRTGKIDGVRRLLEDSSSGVRTGPEEWVRLFDAALNTGALGGKSGLPMDEKSMDLQNLTKSYVDKLTRMEPEEREKLKASIQKFSGDGSGGGGGGGAPGAPAPAMAAPMESLDMAIGLEESELEADGAGIAGDVAGEKSDEGFAGKDMNMVAKKQKSGRMAARDLDQRQRVRQLYRNADRTRELVETHYFRRPIEETNESLIDINQFWLDLAAHAAGSPFLSGRFPLAAGNAPEVMYALALLDLPFTADMPKITPVGGSLEIAAASPLILFHEEVKETPRAEGKARVLVSQDFYPADARHRTVEGEQVDNFVTEEFLPGQAYAGDVVITNPGSLPLEVEVLLQVPQGALPLRGAKQTHSYPMRIEPYATARPSFAFYFSTTGDFTHHPVEIAYRGQIIARAEPFTFHVVKELTRIDRNSWDQISQNGTMEEVLEFLRTRNLHGVDLSRIAFRMHGKEDFARTLEALRERQRFDATLWSYSVQHDDPQAIREYLETTPLADQVGPAFTSTLLTVDPVVRGAYEHYDYDPLIHARAHRLGARHQILNPQLHEEYHKLLGILAHGPAPTDDDWLEASYYLLLQNRIDECLAAFDHVDRTKIAAQVQYDYLHAYTRLLREDLEGARAIAAPHAEHPVPRWRNRFREVLAQLGAPAGVAPTGVDASRDQSQDQLVATEPSLDLDIEAKVLRVSHRNVESFTVNYYPMDVEVLFSLSPFVQEQTSRFSYVRPARSEALAAAVDQPVTKHLIPEDLHARNMMVEVVSGGLRTSKPYFASSLTVQMIESYGQVQVSHLEGVRPAPRLYVKVFARMQDGSVKFYKDGYTDHRLRFDYATLSTDELDRVERFAILVLGDELGAVVREVAPPRR